LKLGIFEIGSYAFQETILTQAFLADIDYNICISYNYVFLIDSRIHDTSAV